MTTPRTILSSRGYSIDKRNLTDMELTRLQRSLTVAADAHPNFPVPSPFPVYEEGTNWIRIPRYYGVSHFGQPTINTFATADMSLRDERCTFTGRLRETQRTPHDQVLNHLFNVYPSGILSLMTGSGKTVIALSLISRLKQRVCILVHKSLLLEQWKCELEQFLPNLRVAVIQQKSKEFSTDYDVYLVMIQTLLNINVVPPIFGFTIVDEVHHLPSQTFSKVLFKVNAPYLLGLSATPERKDGLTKVLHWHLGKIIYAELPDRRNQPTTEVRVVRYTAPYPLDPKRYAAMITSICNDVRRNRLLVAAVKKILVEDVDNLRNVLILTERLEHVNLLQKEIAVFEPDTAVIVGGMKKADVDVAIQRRILIATYMLMSEGNNVPKLNTIVIASPKRDVAQALGRIFRQLHTIVHPIVLDVSDTCLRRQEQERLKTYDRELSGNMRVVYFDEQLRPQKEHLKRRTRAPVIVEIA